MNLVSNAVKFTKEGWITLTLELETTAGVETKPDANQTALKFSVIDSGIGIAEQQLSLLLTPMVQVAPAPDGTSGAGLGLAVSKRLVELLDGRIGIQSEKDKGSTFWFTIPFESIGVGNFGVQEKAKTENTLNLESPEVIERSESSASSESPESFESSEISQISESSGSSINPGRSEVPDVDLSRFNILAVDDNPVVSRLTMLQLASIGVQAVAAMTGQEAIKKASENNFDFILMDVQLPDMTGFEASKSIRKMEERSCRPVSIIIALTGCSSAEDREAAVAVGMDDFLTKPVSIEILKERLIRALSNRSPSL
jgi:CheY-like chemotaxis protein